MSKAFLIHLAGQGIFLILGILMVGPWLAMAGIGIGLAIVNILEM